MFVRLSTHMKLEKELLACKLKLITITNDWNTLVRRVNKAGGEKALRPEQDQLSKEDISRLVNLCHPDKHAGKRSAVEMTQKLLKLR